MKKLKQLLAVLISIAIIGQSVINVKAATIDISASDIQSIVSLVAQQLKECMKKAQPDSVTGITSFVNNCPSELDINGITPVDALIFSKLSYYQFENIYAANLLQSEVDGCVLKVDQQISVLDFAKAVLEKQAGLTKDDKNFLKAVSTSNRYKNCIISDMSFANPAVSQWAAISIDIPGGCTMMAFRGTDSTTLGWAEDLDLVHAVSGTNAQKLSSMYLTAMKRPLVILTGHSKGGCNAVSAYCMSEPVVRSVVARVYNFDGPGINDDFKAAYKGGYDELQGKLENYYPGDSVIGMFLNDNPGSKHYVYCEVRQTYYDRWILGEHDAFAFIVDGTVFREIGQSSISSRMNTGFDALIGRLNHDQRLKIALTLEQMGVPEAIATGSIFDRIHQLLK